MRLLYCNNEWFIDGVMNKLSLHGPNIESMHRACILEPFAKEYQLLEVANVDVCVIANAFINGLIASTLSRHPMSHVIPQDGVFDVDHTNTEKVSRAKPIKRINKKKTVIPEYMQFMKSLTLAGEYNRINDYHGFLRSSYNTPLYASDWKRHFDNMKFHWPASHQEHQVWIDVIKNEWDIVRKQVFHEYGSENINHKQKDLSKFMAPGYVQCGIHDVEHKQRSGFVIIGQTKQVRYGLYSLMKARRIPYTTIPDNRVSEFIKIHNKLGNCNHNTSNVSGEKAIWVGDPALAMGQLC